MLPITLKHPKPLININGKPFLHYVLKNLEKADPNYKDKNTCIVVRYKKDMIKTWVDKYRPDITLVEQGIEKGTGAAVKTVEGFVGNENFIMVNGDDLYDPVDIRKLLDADPEESRICHGIGYPHEDVTKYAAMITDEDGYLKEIIEKPKLNEMPDDEARQIHQALSNPNLWKFTPSVFDALRKVKLSPRGEYEITDAAQLLADERKMKIIEATGYWKKLGCPADVATMESFLKK